MIVNELISDKIPSVTSTDSAGMALDWMSEFKINQMPIVDHGKYIGIVTEDDILDSADLEIPIGEIRYSGWDSAYIFQGNHVYDAIEVMSNLKLEILPILDEDESFMGVITLKDLSAYMGRLFAIQEPGGILVLEIPQHSYVLSEIGRITESADAKVLSLYLAPILHTSDLLVTLKLNLEDLSRVVATFERFDYNVVKIYHKVSQMDDYQENLDALIKYLDL